MSGRPVEGSQVAGGAPEESGVSIERREALRRFGIYAACTAPAMTVLLASRQSNAGSFFRNRAGSGDGAGSDLGGGSCGFSC